MLLPHDYACSGFEHDGRRKLARWLERISWYEVLTRRNIKSVDLLMGGLLLRRSKDANQDVDDRLTSNPNHAWHQSSVKKSWGCDMSYFSRLSVLFMMQLIQLRAQALGSKTAYFLSIVGQVLICRSFPRVRISSLGITQRVSLVPKQNIKLASFIALQVEKHELAYQRVRMTSNSMFISRGDCIGIPNQLFRNHSRSSISPVRRDKY